MSFTTGFLIVAAPFGCILLMAGFALRGRRLRAIQRELACLFEATPCGVVLTDADLTVVRVNHAFENMAGRPRDQIERRMGLLDFVAPEFREEMAENHRLLRSHPNAARRRYRVRFADRSGQRRDMLVVENAVRGSRLCVTSFYDESAAKLNEWAARESHNKFQSIFDNAPVGIFQTSAEGRYPGANDALARIYGYADATDLRENLTDIGRQLYVDPGKRSTFIEAMSVHGEIHDFEAEIRRRDGESIWIRENARVVRDVGGRFLYYEGIVEDITRRHHSEEELRVQNLRLEETLAELKAAQSKLIEQERLHAIGQMASGIAHDFNNTLSPILGYTDLHLRNPTLLAAPDRVRRYVEIINTAARDAANVVRNLRNLYRSRPVSGTMCEIKPAELIAQCIELTQPRWRNQALAQGAEIRVVTDLESTPRIIGDSGELREALTNLIFNAVDALPRGGAITIRLRPDGQTGIHIIVEDSGNGMPPEVREHCFEPFYTTKGERGTGLGLAMVYGVVVRHEGTIDVASEPGRFTRFTLRLPLRPARMVAAEQSAAISLRMPRTILCVDDEPMLLDVVREHLELDRCYVVTAQDGLAALEAFQPGRFDLVVLDQGMPRMSGEMLAEEIRRRAPRQAILMLTGFGDLMMARDEIPAAVDHVLGKPVTHDTLRRGAMRAMQRALQRPQPPSAEEPGDLLRQAEHAAATAAAESVLAAHQHLEHMAERDAQGLGQLGKRAV